MTRRIPFVDALRGIAAVLVVFHHGFTQFPATFAQLGTGPAYRACAAISDLNGMAVLLFFVVSGFSIRLSVEHSDLRQAAGIRHYISRRLKRILPLYLLALASAAACVAVFETPTSPHALSGWTLLGNLLFLQTSAAIPGGWVVPYADNGPLWSLSFEMFYYGIFPLHHALVASQSKRFALAWVVSAAGLACNFVLPNPIGQIVASYGIWYCGAELAQAYLTRSAVPRWLPLGVWVAATAVAFARPSATLHGWTIGLLMLLAGYLLLRAAGANRPAALERIASSAIKPWVWLGSISYALYLLHYPILAGLSHAVGDTPAVLALAVVLSTLLALAAERALHRRVRVVSV
jgi:peptidoglycan/LPS O-acetylase OafA/YrhL